MRTFIYSFVMLLLLSQASMAQKPEAVIRQATTPPQVDGIVDGVWSEANSYNVSKPFTLESPSLGSVGETTWKALWTEQGIYVLVEVADDEFFPYWADGQTATLAWMYDQVEVYFDVNELLEDGEGCPGGSNQGHYQFAPPMQEASIDGSLQEEEGWLYAHLVHDPSRSFELFVPWDYLKDRDGNILDRSGEIGFDVTVVDRDSDDVDRNRAVWANEGLIAESWTNMDDCGMITFEGYIPPSTVEEIILSGGEITEDKGSLQIQALVLPEDASDARLEWRVIIESGSAEIDQNGLLHARTNGTVTVVAKALDDSGVEGSTQVIINNQDVGLEDLNLIRNGNFSRVYNDVYPEEWNAIGEPAATVQEGYAVLDPTLEMVNYWENGIGQQDIGCLKNHEYLFSFVAWAESPRPFRAVFEDPENQWVRYGNSGHEYALMERSEWVFELGTVPTRYEFRVTFDKLYQDTRESLRFYVGDSMVVTYLDSVLLVDLQEFHHLSNCVRVDSIWISSEDGLTSIGRARELQMSAVVFPPEASLPEYTWTIEQGTGNALIDQDGVLKGAVPGTVRVIALAKDGSGVSGEMEILVVAEVYAINVSGEGQSSQVLMDSTLQMIAEISPDDATSKEVDWTVTQGTGNASIDENGLLTGIAPGSVTVRALARDGSGVEGTSEIMVIDATGITGYQSGHLHIYPVPAGDILTVSGVELNSIVQIFNQAGAQTSVYHTDGPTLEIDISDLPPGVYFLRAGHSVAKFNRN